MPEQQTVAATQQAPAANTAVDIEQATTMATNERNFVFKFQFQFFKYCRIYYNTKNHFLGFCLGGLLYIFIIFIFYTSISSYESILFFAILALIGESTKHESSIRIS